MSSKCVVYVVLNNQSNKLYSVHLVFALNARLSAVYMVEIMTAMPF